jgi:hypothetical protein
MVRRVAFKKAVLGGVLGALAWEIVARVLIIAGLPMFDLVRVLGTLAMDDRAAVWQWWPIGMAMHALVGAIWAVFYAYFFWSFYDLPPVLQGVVFAIVPTLLAGFIMVPQMDYMLAGRPELRIFAIGVGWLGPFSVVVGHIVYGIVLGIVYQRPVGYATGKLVKWYG